jgi:hypothetical protein
MGIWGEGPFSNDYAGDFIAGLWKPIRAALEASVARPMPPKKQTTLARARWWRRHPIASDLYTEARCHAAIIVFAYGTDILGGHGLDDVIKLYEKMLADEAWLAGWKDPSRIKRALRNDLLKARGKKNRTSPTKVFDEKANRIGAKPAAMMPRLGRKGAKR